MSDITFDTWSGAPRRVLPDGRVLHFYTQIYNWKLTLSRDEESSRYFWEQCWCYASRERGEQAFREWDGTGEPEGWIRHPTSGRRRRDGDPATEYVEH